jgi:hypothetical protein
MARRAKLDNSYKTLIFFAFLAEIRGKFMLLNPKFRYNSDIIYGKAEDLLGRYINPDGAGKERTQLSKAVVLALRELMRQTEPDEYSQDLASFIAISLQKIYDTVETSVTAWEKKGYWVKADRFRLDWEWSKTLGDRLRMAVINGDWATVAVTSAQVAQRLMKVDVPIRHHLGTPWVGAWAKLKS